MWRRAELALACLLGLAVAPVAAGAHEALNIEDEFVKGVFSPSFTPPPAGTYELPTIKRVPAFVLRDAGGHRVSTQAVTGGKVAVVSFIYTACSDRLGCPPASLTPPSLQARGQGGRLRGRRELLSISFHSPP